MSSVGIIKSKCPTGDLLGLQNSPVSRISSTGYSAAISHMSEDHPVSNIPERNQLSPDHSTKNLVKDLPAPSHRLVLVGESANPTETPNQQIATTGIEQTILQIQTENRSKCTNQLLY